MAEKILIIRHAEKPADDNSILGVTPEGNQDPEELTVRGWQRAGALVRFFSPFNAKFAHPALATPDFLFASAVAKHSNSLRPQHTISPLAQFLGKKLNTDHPKGDEKALVEEVLGCAGNVLIAWEHLAVPGIANRIRGTSDGIPQEWPGDRFDIVWIFDRKPDNSGWDFTQVPQMLLSDDSLNLI